MKQKRYWLRGGLLVAGVGLLIGTFVVVFFLRKLGCLDINYSKCTWDLLQLWENTKLGLDQDMVNSFYPILWLPFSSPVIGFPLGCLMGWIYGKIKNRNKIKQVV